MREKDSKSIAEGLLKEKGKIWKPEEIEEYLRSYDINNKSMIEIVGYLTEGYIFKWLDFISYILPHLATEEEFVGLLKRIILRVKGDLAQGPFIRTLVKIGEEDPELGISLYERMIAEGDADLISYSCFPLGGAGKKNFLEAYSLLKKGVESADSHLKTASIRTLRVIFENEHELKREPKIFEILARSSSENEDNIVQNEVLIAYLDFSRFKTDVCIQQLSRLAKRHNSMLRFNLADNLWLRNLPNREDETNLLTICAEDDNRNVLSRVSLALSKKGQEFPERALAIIKGWIDRGKYFEVYDIDYSIKEIGKVHLDRCITEVEKWIEEKDENKKLQFFIPIVLKDLGSNNYDQLINSVKTWSSRNRAFWRMALETVRAILTEIYPLKPGQERLTDSCFSILEEMARKKNVDIEKTIRGEPDRLFMCFRLIEELEVERQELNFDNIFENSKNYPAIRDFLGERWLRNMATEKNQMHPLLIMLSREPPSKERLEKEVQELSARSDVWERYVKSLRIREMLLPFAFSGYLEDMLGIIVSKTNELRDLKANLRNEDQFWETVSEIEVVSSFIRDYSVEIAPKLDGKRLDAKIQVNGNNLFVEVINPEMFKPLRYLSGKAFDLENRARGKIYDEFKHHLQGLATTEEIPVVIVVDIGRSEIDYDFVEDYLLGTLQLTLLIGKEKGTVAETSSRAKDYMHILEQGTDVLSAVICYKRYFGKDAKFHTEGRIIPNQHAKNPLKAEVVGKIERALFR
jgi:hypothetical protein